MVGEMSLQLGKPGNLGKMRAAGDLVIQSDGLSDLQLGDGKGHFESPGMGYFAEEI